MTEQELVMQCLQDICRKSGFDDPSVMTQRDFEFVSREIEEKTGILISISTIKRLLHGEFSRTPQIATLNAISSYLGFKNWQEYKISRFRAGNGMDPSTKEEAIRTAKRPLKDWKWVGLGIIAIGIILFFSFIKSSSRPVMNFEKVTFSATKTTDNDIPNTVVFNYNVDGVDADSFFIQQSWDRNRRVKVSKDQHTLTDIYYEPGYHVARLIANDKIIKTVDISIPTDKWVFYAKDVTGKAPPQYISTGGIANGILGIPKEDVIKSWVRLENDTRYLMVNFPSKIESSADNFILTCRARVNKVRNNPCPFLMCEIFCQRGFMFIKSKSMGCSNEILAQFGELVLDGRQSDLSSLASDVLAWQDIEIAVINKQVSVRINRKEVYTTHYTESAGLLTGLGFISDGLVEIDFVNLRTVDGKEIYKDEF